MGAAELGRYLKSLRQQRELTLRAVEKETEVSNAYLSQLEGGKIRNPSPTVLHKLSRFYGSSYATLMKSAGYPSLARGKDRIRSSASQRESARSPLRKRRTSSSTWSFSAQDAEGAGSNAMVRH